MRYEWIPWILLFIASAVQAMTPDELRQIMGESEREAAARAQRLNTQTPPIPAGTPSNEKTGSTNVSPAEAAPSTDKAAKDESPTDKAGSKEEQTSKPPKRKSSKTKHSAARNDNAPVGPSANSSMYIAPPRPAYQPVTTPASTSKRRVVYGCRVGTIIKGELRRQTTNVEPGKAEIFVTDDAYCDYKNIPLGSKLFGTKTINGGTLRLDIHLDHLLLPNGKEVPGISAYVRDANDVAGLSGTVINEGKGLERNTTKGAVAALNAAVNSATANDAVGQGVQAGVSGALSDTSAQSEQENQRRLTVLVSPQPVIIYVEQTF
jgi:hypothetical protein